MLALLATLLIAAPAQGASVTWPAQREYRAGERIVVSVRSERRVRVAVLRVSASGKVMRAVTRRTLKRGTVTATLARAGTYAVRVGGRERTYKAVNTPCPAAEEGTLDATLAADRVQRGGTLRFTVTNPGESCVRVDAGYHVEYHQGDGVWKPVPWQLSFPPSPVALDPGEAIRYSLGVPADAPLGTHRLLGYRGFTEPTFEVVA